MKSCCLDALDIFAESNVSFADAFTAAFMKAQGITEIYTWDTDFDRFDWLARVEPDPA